MNCLPGEKEVHADNHQIQAGIIARVKAPEINGHQGNRAPYVYGDKISVVIGREARFRVPDNEILDKHENSREQPVDPKASYQIRGHGKIV